MSITLFGIRNCDTVKKARRWLDQNDIEYTFHDFRKDGINQKLIQDWLTHIDFQALLNKRGTTWRQLTETEKTKLEQKQDLTLLVEQPTLIKRPVLAYKEGIHIGFRPQDYQTFF